MTRTSSFPFLIAEIGSVHDGSFGNALKLIEAAAAAGADAVKFQTHIASAETLKGAPMPPYFKGEPRFEYFTRTGFNAEQWATLKAACDELGVTFLSSPFSLEAVDLLESIGMSHYKIPSGEISNIPLIDRIAKTGKPILLSSGMSSWAEVGRAVEAARSGRTPVLVMQCTTQYPCPPERVGLNVMIEMRTRYGLPVGFSDHTLGPAACMAAVTLGAECVEKHFAFSRLMYGSDARHSMEPHEFKAMADGLHEIRAMLANPVDKNDLSQYGDMKRIFEKSIVTARALPAGHPLVEDDLAFKKPGDGIPAAHWHQLIGRRLSQAVDADHKLSMDDLQ